MIKKILVPTDGSTHARKAIDYAYHLALKFGATVHLLHVIPNSELLEGLDRYIEVDRIEAPRERVLDKIGDAIIKAKLTQAEARDMEAVKSSVVNGNAVEKIAEFAEENRVHMIIMTLFLGTVSSKVCHADECTCVTIKYPARSKIIPSGWNDNSDRARTRYVNFYGGSRPCPGDFLTRGVLY